MSNRMGEELIESMQELLDYSEGKIDLRTSKFPVTPVCEMISPAEIKAVRENLKMSQSVFAIVMGVHLSKALGSTSQGLF